MKKLIILMFCMVFLLGTISAFEFDNKKYYDEETKTITIKNSFLGLPLDKAATVQLTTPREITINNVYEHIAEFEIENFKKYKNFIKKVETFKRIDGGDVLNYGYIYKYYNENIGTHSEWSEEQLQYANGTTYIKQVETIVPGSWVSFDEKVELSTGRVKIRMFFNPETKLQRKRIVEVVPTFFGKRIQEWFTVELQEFYDTGMNSVSVMRKEPEPAEYIRQAQCFTPLEVYTIETIGVNISTLGNDEGILWGGVYFSTDNTSAGTPDSPASQPIGTFTNISNGTVANTFSFVNLTFSDNNVTTIDNVTICMVLRGTGTDVPSNLYSWSEDTSGTYTFGNRHQRVGNGAWAAQAARDQMFRVWSIEGDPPVVTTTNPVNLSTIRNQTVEFAGTVSDDFGLVNVSLFLAKVGTTPSLNQTNSSPVSGSQTNFTVTLSEGTYDWYYEAWDDNSPPGQTNGSGMRFTVDTSPQINVFSPTNTTFSTSTIFFNATNSTPVDRWIVNYNGTNITLSDINTSLEVEDGIHQLFLYANNSDSGVFGVNDTIFFSVDGFNPVIIIHNPTNSSFITNYTTTSTLNVTINSTATDTNLDTCWIEFTNGTNQTITCNVNKTLTGQPFNINTYRLWANDTLGKTNHTNRTATFDFNVFESSVTFPTQVTEGATEDFSIKYNISNSLITNTVNIIYNGTSTLATTTGASNPFVANISVIIPGVEASTIHNFTWEFTLSDGNTYSSGVFQTTANKTNIDDCSVFTNVIYNLTILDEGNQTMLDNVTLDINLDLFTESRSVKILNYSQTTTNVNPVVVCFESPLAAATNYSLDTIIKYESLGYSIEYYNIENFLVQNSSLPQEISLFDLILTDTTEFQITFSDEDFVPVENALVFIDRQYIAENNTFKTVELPKTDSNGQTIGHFVRNDVVYNIRFIKGEEVLGNFQNIIAFCQDFTIGDCQMILDATGSTGEIFDYNSAVGIVISANPSFNNETNVISVSFSTIDGNPQLISMNVTRNDVFGNRSLCSDSLTSASGTLSCSINPNIDETTLVTTVSASGQTVLLSTLKIQESGFGAFGYALWFILTLSLILMIGEHKTGVFLAMVLSYVGAVALGFTEGTIVGAGAAGIWIAVISLVGLYKINKENPQ